MISQTTLKHVTASCISPRCWKGNPVILLLLDAEVLDFIAWIIYMFDLHTTQESLKQDLPLHYLFLHLNYSSSAYF